MTHSPPLQVPPLHNFSLNSISFCKGYYHLPMLMRTLFVPQLFLYIFFNNNDGVHSHRCCKQAVWGRGQWGTNKDIHFFSIDLMSVKVCCAKPLTRYHGGQMPLFHLCFLVLCPVNQACPKSGTRAKSSSLSNFYWPQAPVLKSTICGLQHFLRTTVFFIVIGGFSLKAVVNMWLSFGIVGVKLHLFDL